MILTPRFDEALTLAVRLHRNDVRKGKSTPYVAHILGVCSLVLQDGGDEDQAIAALLHDALEDHPEEIRPEQISEQFGETVLAMVQDCTDTPAGFGGGEKPPWRARKEQYLAHIRHASPGSRRVSTADKLYNARELLSDLRREGARTSARFNAGPKDQIWFYQTFVDEMLSGGESGTLILELKGVVAELSTLMAGPASHT